MKKLQVVAAGLGYRLLDENGMTDMAGLHFTAASGVFPAVTCVAQASLRTGRDPSEHGIISDGIWMADLCKPLFWEPSAQVVKGPRVWSRNAGLFFFQQSLGEDVSLVVAPTPVRRHGGGAVMSCYTKPTGMEPVLKKLCGAFPFWRYRGPFASPKVGRTCIDYFEEMTNVHDVDEAYLYLPTLDCAAQKYGPKSSAAQKALKELRRQLERLADLCTRRGCELKVTGDYEISEVTSEPVCPNVLLRHEGLFKTRTVAGRSYPDFYQSTAFALCDHEVAVIVGAERERAVELLLASGDFTRPPAQAAADQTILLVRPGSWCGYEWWTDRREAPDYASHVDAPDKPGCDPKELFLFNCGRVKGTHGRFCEVAHA